MILIDTNIAIHWLDGNAATRDLILSLDYIPSITAITRAELENEVYRAPAYVDARRQRLDGVLEEIDVVAFDDAAAAIFGSIVEQSGYLRTRTLDRMIAAVALVHDAIFITMNGRDFRDIPGLKLEVWDSPPA